MGRSALMIKTAELQDCVRKLEASRNFGALSELCYAIEMTDWAKNIRNEKHAVRGLSAQVAAREIKARGITCQTKPGRRGRVVGQVVVKVSRKDKAAKLGLNKYAAALKEEVADAPERYQRYAELALEGNPLAACKLKCGACMGYTGAEKSCDGGLGGTPCPLYVLNRIAFTKRLGFEAGSNGFYELRKAVGVEAS